MGQDDMQEKKIDLIAAPILCAPSLSFHRIRSYSRSPDIAHGDYALVKPVAGYVGDGDYLDDFGNPVLVQTIGAGRLLLHKTFCGKTTEEISQEDFKTRVRAHIVGVLKITSAAAIPDIMGMFP